MREEKKRNEKMKGRVRMFNEFKLTRAIEERFTINPELEYRWVSVMPYRGIIREVRLI
jgi:hypothetical protein